MSYVVSLVVRLKLPVGATKRDAERYVRDSVQSWKGGMSPDDPMFDLDYKTVKVIPLRDAGDKE